MGAVCSSNKSNNVSNMAAPFPDIKSKNSLVAKYITKEKWEKLSGLKTKTTGFTLGQVIACGTHLDNQKYGFFAGDWDTYKVFAEVLDPMIQEVHGINPDSKHVTDMDFSKIQGNINPEAPVHSIRIRVGRNIDGFGLSPGISKDKRREVESLFAKASKKFTGELAGQYYPVTGMDKATEQKLIDDHFLFDVSHDKVLQVSGGVRDWPDGRGIYFNNEKSFLVWVNEEDHFRIISMQKGSDVRAVINRLGNGIKGMGDVIKSECGKDFMLDDKYGFVTTCPTNLGTGMRASVHIDLPGWTKHGFDKLKERCIELKLQPRGTMGESVGQTGHTYDISNKYRLGYSEVELVQTMIDGVNTLYKEDLELQKA